MLLRYPSTEHNVCVLMWEFQCPNIAEWHNYYVADLVLGEQEITAQEKEQERKILSVLTVNDRKEENKVPSSYLDSLAKTPSKMVTNYEHKKTRWLFSIIEQGCTNQLWLQRRQWSSQHCQGDGQCALTHGAMGGGDGMWVQHGMWQPAQPLLEKKLVVLALVHSVKHAARWLFLWKNPTGICLKVSTV